ncbi:MAG: Rid family hydrolase [Pseudomonadota bacterium]|nr:Rid family hydrolase [Pseudomonadota bacterium]
MTAAAQDPVFWFDHTRPLFEPLGCVDARRRGRWVFVSAQAGINAQLVALDGLAMQADRAFSQLKAAYVAVGGDSSAVCQLTVYVNTGLLEAPLTEASDVIFGSWKSNFPGSPATGALVGAQMFGIPRLLLEIQCIGRVGRLMARI